MSSRSKVGRSAAARKNYRASSCLFTFSDGRRCRTPRTGNHPHFCFDHAQKEARARAAETIGKDLAYFFSGDYLSACDLSTALGRLIPAVIRGDIKPKTARTVAYLAQTLLRSIRLAQEEYINALGSNRWRNAIANSVNENLHYRFPPAPAPNVVAGLQTGAVQAPQPTPSPTAPTAAALNVAAGLQPGSLPATPHVQPAPPNPQPTAQPIPTPPPAPAPSPTSPPAAAQTTATTTNVTPPIPATQPAPSIPPAAAPGNPAPTTPPPPRPPDRTVPWFDPRDAVNLRPDGKLL